MIFINSKNRGPYHLETSLLIFKANQWTGFYMIGTSVIKEGYHCLAHTGAHLENVKIYKLLVDFPLIAVNWQIRKVWI